MTHSIPLQRETDVGAVAVRAADRIAALLAARPEAVLLLPAGATPIPVYRELARRRVDASRAWIVQLDELVGVAPTDPRSFAAFLAEHWLGPFATRPERALLLDGSAPDPAAEIARHAARLRALPRPDLVLLGIGCNGHVAFNEPGTTLQDGARVVELAATTRDALGTHFDGAAPTHGMTLGLAELSSGAATLLLATGASKAAVLTRLATEPPSPSLPVSLLAGVPNVELLADAAALPG
ncbi:MAG: 6-phosphogluconolactonase [Planctomycetota bacterium]